MKLSPLSRQRPGVALVMALVVMATLSVILSVVTMQIVSQRQLLHQRHRQLQAEWLARAGVELAAARLLESAAGFIDKLELLPDATVRIEVEKANPDSFVAKVVAELGHSERALVTRATSRRFRRTDTGDVIRLQALP